MFIHCFSSYLVVELTVIRNHCYCSHCCFECMKMNLINNLFGRPLNKSVNKILFLFSSLLGALTLVLLMIIVIVLLLIKYLSFLNLTLIKFQVVLHRLDHG